MGEVAAQVVLGAVGRTIAVGNSIGINVRNQTQTAIGIIDVPTVVGGDTVISIAEKGPKNQTVQNTIIRVVTQPASKAIWFYICSDFCQ